MEKISFLAIGDITTDAFIRLKEANVNCDINLENCTLSMRFADKIPYESVEEVNAVGNSPNAAVAVARLGLSSAVVSNLADDDNGEKCSAVLKREQVTDDFVSVKRGGKTNYHYVLWYEDERTILVKHEEFEYKLPALPEAEWVYLSSIGSGTLSYHEEIKKYLEGKPETKLTFQPGTFQMSAGIDAMKYFYGRAELLVVNMAEARQILKANQDTEVKELLKALRALGSKIVCITDGPKGAYMNAGSGNFFMPIYPDPKPPLERTGCGDAFAATFSAALLFGKTAEEALAWAPINPMSVVQHVGAQKGLLTREQIEKFLSAAPSNYAPRKIN